MAEHPKWLKDCMAEGGKVDPVSGKSAPSSPSPKAPLMLGIGFKKGGWIKGATQNKGALHRALKVPMGEKIPAKKLAKAAHSDNPTMRRRANLAKTLKKMHG